MLYKEGLWRWHIKSHIKYLTSSSYLQPTRVKNKFTEKEQKGTVAREVVSPSTQGAGYNLGRLIKLNLLSNSIWATYFIKKKSDCPVPMWSQSLLIEVLSEKKCSWFGFMRCRQNSFWTTEKSLRTNDAWFATQWNKDPPLYPSPHLYQLYLHGRVRTRDLTHTSHVVLIPLDQSPWGVYKFEKKVLDLQDEAK